MSTEDTGLNSIDAVGDRAVVTVERMAYGNDGVGRLPSGRVVFVPGSVPGDTLSITLTEVADRFARGTIEKIEEPSPHRVAPRCPYGSVCGGCPWQQMSYDQQLVWKRRAVVDALTRNAKLPADAVEALVEPCRGSQRQWNYRNKVEFEVTTVVKGGQPRLTLGLHAAGSNQVVPIEECLLLPKRLTKAPKQLTGALRYAAGDDPTGLDIKRVGIRVSLATGSREVALWTSPAAFPRHQVAKVVTDALRPTSVVRVLIKEKVKARKVVRVETLAGSGSWTERIGDEEMTLSAPSFFQVNTAQAEQLVSLVRENLNPGGEDLVLDLYSGAGTFTLPLARRAGEVLAIESYGSSTRDLERNLIDSGLEAEVICDDVARVLPDVGEDANLAVVDPPRAGLSAQALKAVADLPVRRLVYVSCDPATLGRDLKVLAGPDGPFRLARVTPVDLFPQTYHVETVALLTRKLSNAKSIVVEIDTDTLKAEKKPPMATYANMRKWIREELGLKVSAANIAAMKDELGLEKQFSYEEAGMAAEKRPGIPEEKRQAIIKAFGHFGLIKPEKDKA